MHSIQRGEWQEGSGFSLLEHPIKELSGKKLGIVGFGVLGKGVAKAAYTGHGNFDLRKL